ncbi:MAG: DUF3027 domain-containing protein [Candidatus Nanopelagicales bacterium]
MTSPDLDSVLASAVDLARAAVLEIAPAEHVGEHVEAVADADLLVSHYFACTSPAYRGWRWAVTVVRVPEADVATVDEVVLLPGGDALLPPEWVPWSERVRPGDLSPGDLFPTEPDDLRLEPGYTGGDALEEADTTASTAAPLRPEQWQLGLGREQVLSAYGRDLAAERWWDGEFGPDSPMAKAAPAPCGTCGFLLPMGGLVGQAFGVCANPFGADGRVVALGYGCGAHSSVRAVEGTGVPVTDIVVDELQADELDVLTPADEAAEAPAEEVVAVVVEDDEVVVVDLEADDAPVAEAGVADVEASDDEDVSADDDSDSEDDDSDDDEDADDDSDDDEDSDDDVSDAADEDDIEDIEPDEVLA